uniref:Uncharacterized protein n=1 Tax=Fagus sylvatica TaxID=28930 RepID=A0A2N9EJ66_FAGSY
MSFVSLAAIPLPSRLFLAVVTTGVVLRWWRWVVDHWTSWQSKRIWASRWSQADLASRWASAISLSPDCVTGLRGGLELGRASAPRTGVAHMIVMICGGFYGGLRWV